MRTLIFMISVTLSVVSCEAADPVTITCGIPVKSGDSKEWITVPVRINNTSKVPVIFFAGGTVPTYQEFVTRGTSTNRWKNITISMQGMCALGYVAPNQVTLGPGESFDSTSGPVCSKHLGHLFRVSLKVGKASAPDRQWRKIYSSAVLLR